MFWFDNSEDVMQLFIWHKDSDAWIPVAPPTTLEGRVSAGEATQAAMLSALKSSDNFDELKAKLIKLLEAGDAGEES